MCQICFFMTKYYYITFKVACISDMYKHWDETSSSLVDQMNKNN